MPRLCPPIASPICEAVEKLSENPLLVLKNLELLVSYLTQAILAFEGLDDPAAGTQVARLNTLNNHGYLPTALIPFFHTLAGKNHGNNTSSAAIRMQANLHLNLAAQLTTWFLKSYGPYLPSSAAATSSAEDLRIIEEKIQAYIPHQLEIKQIIDETEKHMLTLTLFFQEPFAASWSPRTRMMNLPPSFSNASSMKKPVPLQNQRQTEQGCMSMIYCFIKSIRYKLCALSVHADVIYNEKIGAIDNLWDGDKMA